MVPQDDSYLLEYDIILHGYFCNTICISWFQMPTDIWRSFWFCLISTFDWNVYVKKVILFHEMNSSWLKFCSYCYALYIVMEMTEQLFLTHIYGQAFAILNTDLGKLSKIATILVFSNFLLYKMKQLPFSILHHFLSSSFKCLKVRFQSENMKSAENTTALCSDISDINQWAPDASCMLGWSAFFRTKHPPKFSCWQIFHRKYFSHSFILNIYRWLSAKLQKLQGISTGVTAVLHWAIDIMSANHIVIYEVLGTKWRHLWHE